MGRRQRNPFANSEGSLPRAPNKRLTSLRGEDSDTTFNSKYGHVSSSSCTETSSKKGPSEGERYRRWRTSRCLSPDTSSTSYAHAEKPARTPRTLMGAEELRVASNSCNADSSCPLRDAGDRARRRRSSCEDARHSKEPAPSISPDFRPETPSCDPSSPCPTTWSSPSPCPSPTAVGEDSWCSSLPSRSNSPSPDMTNTLPSKVQPAAETQACSEPPEVHKQWSLQSRLLTIAISMRSLMGDWEAVSVVADSRCEKSAMTREAAVALGFTLEALPPMMFGEVQLLSSPKWFVRNVSIKTRVMGVTPMLINLLVVEHILDGADVVLGQLLIERFRSMGVVTPLEADRGWNGWQHWEKADPALQLQGNMGNLPGLLAPWSYHRRCRSWPDDFVGRDSSPGYLSGTYYDNLAGVSSNPSLEGMELGGMDTAMPGIDARGISDELNSVTFGFQDHGSQYISWG